jgi:hypothetical protein
MSINQLDLGTTVQFVKTYLGPSLGWAHLPVQPNLIVTSAAPLTVPAFASRIVLNAAVKLILLPSIASWVTPQATQEHRLFRSEPVDQRLDRRCLSRRTDCRDPRSRDRRHDRHSV